SAKNVRPMIRIADVELALAFSNVVVQLGCSVAFAVVEACIHQPRRIARNCQTARPQFDSRPHALGPLQIDRADIVPHRSAEPVRPRVRAATPDHDARQHYKRDDAQRDSHRMGRRHRRRALSWELLATVLPGPRLVPQLSEADEDQNDRPVVAITPEWGERSKIPPPLRVEKKGAKGNQKNRKDHRTASWIPMAGHADLPASITRRNEKEFRKARSLAANPGKVQGPGLC